MRWLIDTTIRRIRPLSGAAGGELIFDGVARFPALRDWLRLVHAEFGTSADG
ncbi:hypothetical protein [Saccharopolyspora elongata]|uniref:hypothetical protein n=1 Tax=Saccharopolyspora elongata TaxID=2530387 RepID=UPI001404FC62|nr:hypothetical protein [Saccharopolyspora elongata]